MDIDFLETLPKPDQNIIFRLGLRPNKHAIVRNHFENGYWGDEECGGPFFRVNKPFEIIVFAQPNCFYISYNGEFMTFSHRMPMSLIKCFNVSGDGAIISHISMQ